MENKHLIFGLIVAVLVVGYFAFNSSSATVSAQGSSVLEVEPDIVGVWFSVEGRGDTAKEAKAVHDEIIDSLLSGLFRAGVDRDSIKQVNYNIYPEYEWNEGVRKQIGYVANQLIVVEIEDFDLTADVVDSGVEAGALVNSIQFELSEGRQNELKAKALEEAGKDARKKAEATARGLDKSLGSLVSVKGEEFNYGPYRFFEVSEAGSGGVAEVKDAVANIAPRDIEVRATVFVEYKLGIF